MTDEVDSNDVGGPRRSVCVLSARDALLCSVLVYAAMSLYSCSVVGFGRIVSREMDPHHPRCRSTTCVVVRSLVCVEFNAPPDTV